MVGLPTLSLSKYKEIDKDMYILSEFEMNQKYGSNWCANMFYYILKYGDDK